MKKCLLCAALAVMVLSSTGCNSCRTSRWNCMNWFSRGDTCDSCPPGGIPRGAGFAPSMGTSMGPYGAPIGPEYLPGPASALPTVN